MKKGMFSKLFILLLVVGLLFAVAPTQQAQAEGPDTGWHTGDSLYKISSADQLAGLAQLVNEGNNFSGKTITLTENIDLGAYAEWTPIGTTTNAFAGVFDGGGNTISNLKIDSQVESIGLFGKVSGTIQNFTLDGATINGRDRVGGASGSLYPSGKIINVTVKNITINAKHFAGGIAGHVYGRLENVHAYDVAITLTFDEVISDNGDKAGGLVGYMDESTLLNCSVTRATISGTRDNGGLVGTAGGSTITNCTATDVNVTSTNIVGNSLTPYTGGGIGRASGALTLTNIVVNNANLTSTPAGYTGLVVGGGAGAVTLSNVKLVHGTAETFYATIQAAIDAASADDTILVAPGTYVENIDINKVNLTIKGASDPFGTTPAIIQGMVTMSANNATIFKMKIAPGNVSGNAAAIFVTANNIYIEGNLIDGMAGDGTGTVKGIHVFGGSADVAVSLPDIFDNTIRNISNADKGTDGIMIQGNVYGAKIKGNTIENISSTDGWAWGIEVTPSSGVADKVPEEIHITENVIKGVTGPIGAAALSVDRVNEGFTADASQVFVSKNQLLTTSPTLAIVNKDEANQLAASPNWFGSLYGPAADTIFGDVDYTPWCANAECTEFYEPPVHNVTQGTYFETIQAAINAATAEDEITVAAGEYEENLTINKALTLTGAGADKVTVNGYMVINAPDLTIEGFKFVGRNSDTAIRLLYEIGLTFKNNIVTADNPAVMVLFENNFSSPTAGFSNLVITDNKFISNGQQRILYLNPYYTTLTITDNTFEGLPTTGPVLGLDGLDGDETISGNNFTNITSSYALFETFGVVSIPIPVEPYFAGNTFPVGYYPIGNMVKIPDTKLYMSADDMMIDLNGPDQVVEVMATDVEALTGYTVIVDFDHTKLHVESIDNGTLLKATEDFTVVNFTVEDNGNSDGRLIVHANLEALGGVNKPVDGSGSLIKITFKPIAFGETKFKIQTGSILVSWPDVFRIPYEITGGAEVNVVGFGPGVPWGYIVGYHGEEKGWYRGISTDFAIVGADLTDATSLTVKLYSGEGGTTVLQTNTANLENFEGIAGFTSPFDIFGNFDYTIDVPDGGGTTPYWVNERADTEYGQTELPTCVEATATLAGGTVITKKYCGPLNPSDRSLLLKGTIERDPGNTGDVPDGTPLTVTQSGDTINFKGDIAWYPADAALGRTEGNRVGVEINAPGGFDTTNSTFTFNGKTYNWEEVAGDDIFVWVYPKVTEVPQGWDIVVTWATGFVQTFTVNVLDESTLVQPLLPTITSTDVQGPYIPHVPQEFNFTVSNAGGAYYERAIFEYKIDGITLADITKFEFYAVEPDPDAGNWVEMGTRATEPYITCEGDTTAICGQFGWAPNGFGPFPTGFTSAPKFRVTFKNGQTADLPMTLTLKGKKTGSETEWTTLQTFNVAIKVYENLAITGTAPAYYLVGDPDASTITITNPTGGAPYGNHIEFNLTIFGAVKADIASATCDYGPIVGFDILDKLAEVDGNLVGTLFPADGAFSVAAPFDMTVTCTMKFNTAKTYNSKYEMVYVVGTDKFVVAKDEPSAVIYTKPVITSTDLPTTFQQGVEKAVTVNVNNVDAMYTPSNSFILHLDLPEGMVVAYGTESYTCTATGCDIPVTLAVGDNALALMITFDAASTADIVISLVDTVVDPDRTLADFTATNTVYASIGAVTGMITMQARTSFASTDVVTLTGLTGYGPYKETTNAAGNYSFANLIATEYTVTTNQDRYLNITAEMGKKITLGGTNTTIKNLWLRGGNVDNTTDGSVNKINLSDATVVSTDWGKLGDLPGDANFDLTVNIQDLALVGGNYGLTAEAAYESWLP
jgi:hypothetical protein